MTEDDLADIPDDMQSLPLIAKHLNCHKIRIALKICIVHLGRKHPCAVPGWLFLLQTLGLKTWTTTP